ncbi:2580_t:CDS:2, partial [Gigaspora rosea]
HEHIYQHKATKLKLKRLECGEFTIIIHLHLAKFYYISQSILKKLIEQETERSTDISVRNICSGNIISFFEDQFLSELHVSLNNIDKIRKLVQKAQHQIYPFGQDIL